MGNIYSIDKVNLRDEDINLPSCISTVRSNMIMGMTQGNFYPCIIIRNAETIDDGYTVYFFHNSEQTEIPSTNVIGNLKALLHCQVNFVDENGATCTGIVRGTDHDRDQKQPMNFFVATPSCCKWVSLPFIFMTKEQAKELI